jgi:hypothetical protein
MHKRLQPRAGGGQGLIAEPDLGQSPAGAEGIAESDQPPRGGVLCRDVLWPPLGSACQHTAMAAVKKEILDAGLVQSFGTAI